MADTMNFGPEWVRSLSSGSNQNGPPSPVKPTTPLSKRLQFKLAEFRYGKEELLQLCTDDQAFPSDLPVIATITRTELVTPLAFIPLSEEEQIAMSGGVNSGTVYGIRGGRGYYSRGRGRGRGRGDYHRSTSYPEDHQSGGYYGNRGSGDWSDNGRGYGGGRGSMSRASRDGNWRNPSSTAEDEEWATNHWNPPPSPGKQPPGGWKDKDSDQKWQAIPEWANDDEVTAKSVGTFDSSGKFTTGSKDSEGSNKANTMDSKDKKPQKMQLQNPPSSRSDMKKDSLRTNLSYSSVASSKDGPPSVPNSAGNQELIHEEPDVAQSSSDEEEVFEDSHRKSSPTAASASNPSQQSEGSEDWVASPSSVEDERMKQIEKAAEALLSTEEEETPVPSPTVPESSSTKATSSSQPLHPAPANPSPPVNPEDLNKWLYQDPQGEIQGPFSSADMKKWFDAGYFTMDLMVRRACDLLLLPLGHVIRVWGRPPFNASGPVPPPLRPEELFWQNLFKQPQVMYQQQLMMQQVMKSQQQQAPQEQQAESAGGKLPQATPVPASTSTEAASIWSKPKSKSVKGEDQWPDITGSEGSLWDQETTAKQQAIEEKNTKIEQQRLQEMRKMEEERILMEKQKQQQLAEEKQRQLLQEQQRRMAEEHQRQLEERQRQLEAERQKKIEEKKRKDLLEAQRKAEEKRQQQIKEELERQRKLEEETRIAKQLEEKRRQEQTERERQHQMLLRQQQQQQAWLQQQQQQQFSTAPGRQTGPSLLQIQQEEEAQAVERRREETLRAQYQAQQAKNQQHSGWSSAMTAGPQPRTVRPASNKAVGKPKSFLEIQQEQESAFQTPVSAVTISHSVKEQQRTTKNTWSNVTSKQSWPQAPALQPHREKAPSMSTDNDDDSELSFWEECDIEAKNNPVPSAVQKKSSQKRTNTSKEEERIRRLLSSNDASSEFNSWCEIELRKFNTDVDAATFVSFLLEVDSVYEVHDYIKSYLGETKDAHDFAKQFLDKRQKLKPSQQSVPKKSKSRDRALSNSGEDGSTRGGSSAVAPDQDIGTGSSSRAKQKKKKRMQKVNAASLLGFTVNAADRPNMGEIQSVRDTM